MTSLHPSIQKDLRVAEYFSAHCKYYYLPLFSSTLFDSEIESILGAANPTPRSSSEIRSSMVKAQSGGYSHIKIPFDRTQSAAFDEVFKLAKEKDLKIVLQICSSLIYDDSFFKSLQELPQEFEVEWVLDSVHYKVESRILQLRSFFRSSHLTIPVRRKTCWNDLLKPALLESFGRVHLYCGYAFELNSGNLHCQEVFEIVTRLRKEYVGVDFLPPKGVDIWDHRARSDFDMEPFFLPCFQTRSSSPDVEFSVVIPTYNNQNHLRVVLRHLYRQSVGLDKFEVIVVDDGGTDQTQPLVFDLIRSFPEKMNFKYVFFPRMKKRVMGDSQYRAGISRNLGVKNSEGKYLCFLDSDIVVPNDYLLKVGRGLQKWGGLQAKRVNLSRNASHLNLNIYDINPDKDLIPDEAYWEEFLQSKDWHLRPFNWKYVCTHSFSIRKDLFWEIGGLKKNFIYYGFEDTDLGYRLVKAGHQLHLLDVEVFHLFHENTRSEFMNLSSLRNTLLSRTAQIFYLHHLDDEIFHNLVSYMEPEPSFRRLVHQIAKGASLQFIWKSRPEVFKTIKAHQKKRPPLIQK